MTMQPRPVNWAGNVTFAPAAFVVPDDVDELCAAIADRRGRRVKALGSAHSFTAIADTDGLLVATDRLTGIGPIDEQRRTVTIEAGVCYAQLAPWLHERGWALHNLPSLPHLTIAGAVATGTHGSGSAHGGLATAVTALELVGADGARRRFERGDDDYEGLPVSVGSLGVVARVELAIEPTYDVEQTVWSGLVWDSVLANFDAVVDVASSVSLFTTWAGDEVDQVWTKQRVGVPADAGLGDLGARRFAGQVHPVGGDPSTCTTQLGLPGPWHERLTHFRDGFRPGTGAELQSELFVDREVAVDAIAALRELRDVLEPVLLAGEVRTIAADGLWLSGAFGRDTVAFHFTWRLDPVAVAPVIAHVERRLDPFEPRPHWGKLTSLDATTIRSRYPMIERFDVLRGSLDPEGAFDNDALGCVLG